jgi:hypothetical protein
MKHIFFGLRDIEVYTKKDDARVLAPEMFPHYLK